MLHPSYTELIAKANEGLEPGDEPVDDENLPV